MARWPIREAILAYLEHLKREAMEDYRWSMVTFAVLAPWSKNAKPPELPEILK